MSKSPNILFPALGGTVLVLGLSYAVAAGTYKATAFEPRAEAPVVAASATVEAPAAAAPAAVTAPVVLASATVDESVQPRGSKYGLGRAATAAEVEAWDGDVAPDGTGLPVGSGDIATGEKVFIEQCAVCHGDFGEGADAWPPLAGGFGTLADEDPYKTIGSYWPYLSTAWDYIKRSMPFGAAGTLTDDETYAIVAYLMYMNDLVDEDFVLSNENFLEVRLPNEDGFVVDDRDVLEYAQWRTEPCMTNCKETVEVTMRASFVDVTPADGGESVMNHGTTTELPTFTQNGIVYPEGYVAPTSAAAPAAAEEEAAAPAAVEATPASAGGLDMDLVAKGEKVFKKCKACHAVGDGAKNKSGPHLNDVFGRAFGGIDGFKYSNVFKDANANGMVWDEANVAEFLASPKGYLKGTKMSFSGLKKEKDIAAVIEYLKSFSQ
ncbi:MAG: c-type cytochrome [Planktomarina sp.]